MSNKSLLDCLTCLNYCETCKPIGGCRCSNYSEGLTDSVIESMRPETDRLQVYVSSRVLQMLCDEVAATRAIKKDKV